MSVNPSPELSRETIDRRRFVRTALLAGGLPAVASLPGCAALFEALAGSCPDDPAESGGVDWTPDVLRPVFYGYRDYTAADGAPATLRMFYPTYEGFTAGPPILKLCLVRWPVVLFLHGQPPCPLADYHRLWFLLPAVLARCGYVVAVPSHAAAFPGEAGSPGETLALDVIDWVRDGWEHDRWVDKRPEATAVAGHSYGALLAARVAAARPSISAYVGLSGPFTEFGNPVPVLQGIGAPSFFMWATGNPITGAFENLDGGGMWNQVPSPKAAAVHPGEHFDYISPTACGEPRGPCTLIQGVAADLAALFITRYAPLASSTASIPVDLEPPSVTLTPQQQFFAGAHLSGLSQIATREGCDVDLRWQDGGASGSRQLGP